MFLFLLLFISYFISLYYCCLITFFTIAVIFIRLWPSLLIFSWNWTLPSLAKAQLWPSSIASKQDLRAHRSQIMQTYTHTHTHPLNCIMQLYSELRGNYFAGSDLRGMKANHKHAKPKQSAVIYDICMSSCIFIRLLYNFWLRQRIW